MQSIADVPFIRCTIMGNKTEQLIDINKLNAMYKETFPHNGTMGRMETEICVRNRFHVSIPWMGHQQLKSI